MMELAKQTLDDLRITMDSLNAAENEQMLRILVFAAIGLNRSVGCALMKDPSADVRKASDDLYQEWKQDKDGIFMRFIKPYRDFVLHEAKTNLKDGGAIAVIDPEQDLVLDIYYEEALYVTVEPFEDERHHHYYDYGDLDIRDLLEESISWWEEQLERIEEIVSIDGMGIE